MPVASVVVYSTNYCPFCDRAKALLRKKGVSFQEVNVEDRPDLRSWLVERTRQRTVPQVFINGQAVGGFVDLAALDRAGTLDGLLERAPGEQDPRTLD